MRLFLYFHGFAAVVHGAGAGLSHDKLSIALGANVSLAYLICHLDIILFYLNIIRGNVNIISGASISCQGK